MTLAKRLYHDVLLTSLGRDFTRHELTVPILEDFAPEYCRSDFDEPIDPDYLDVAGLLYHRSSKLCRLVSRYRFTSAMAASFWSIVFSAQRWIRSCIGTHLRNNIRNRNFK